ncbi:MerR family transcriptional regulator [Sphingobacteriaceae bacterium]|nr:MerR family transcriptional regulator [Sphingobacteriaceae bacterium]
MSRFTVNQLAKLAGVSVRTLHHYDDIGLLEPGTRTESNYRYYGEEELLRLQQILFYKELDLPLAKIVEILDDPSFDTASALKSHKNELLKRKKRTMDLLQTIDKTLKSLSQKSKLKKMKAEDMYHGFDKEQLKAYEKEATEKYGSDIMNESKLRMKQMGKEGLDKLLAEGEEITKELSKLMNLKPDDEKVQALIKRHYKMMGGFYTVTPEIYQGLADLYVNDDRFKKNYEKHKEGLAKFLREGMLIYCKDL